MKFLKIILFTLITSASINLLAFGLRFLMPKKELGDLISALAFSTVVAIVIGMAMILNQKKILGWSMIIGAGLTSIFWAYALYSLSQHGW
ncbi:MAG: hypothetical protein WDO14_15260 [Bacteroidota bacterium]